MFYHLKCIKYVNLLLKPLNELNKLLLLLLLNLESDSELSDAASIFFIAVEPVDVEFEEGECCIAY